MNREFRRHPTHPALPILPVSSTRILDQKVTKSAINSTGKGRKFLKKNKGRESRTTSL